MHRRRFLLCTAATVSATVTGGAAGQGAPTDRRAQLEQLFRGLHAERRFTGAVLVAERGHVLYAGGWGAADPATGRLYTADTRSCLASLSKPITAVATMLLAGEGRLRYDDPLSAYLPGFSEAIGGATLRHLLTHTSGIPDYPQLNVDRPGVTNGEILAALRQVRQPAFQPGQRYAYSNSGYVLLALVIERVSGLSLPRFLDTRIFTPLGMAATFVLTGAAQKTADVARGYDRSGRIDDFEGMATGESGVYSTVGDLLRFDQALYTDRLVSQASLAEAFVPAPVREGVTTYGLGWNIATDEDGVRVWHQGNTAGFRAFIERRLRRRITVVMLTNGGDTDRMGINSRIQDVLRSTKVSA
jgi:CubicO group peptidase (beta-lactamase class C family)